NGTRRAGGGAPWSARARRTMKPESPQPMTKRLFRVTTTSLAGSYGRPSPSGRTVESDPALEPFPVPAGQVGRGLVGRLEKRQEEVFRRVGAAHLLIGQQELPELLAEEGGRGLDLRLGEPRRRGVGVGVVGGMRVGNASRPEAAAHDFLRVRLAHHPIGQVGYAARMLRRRPAGKARDGEGGSSPEVVNGAALAGETAAEHLQDPVRREKDAPIPVRVFRVVRGMTLVLGEWNRMVHLVRGGMDPDVQPQARELAEELLVERRDGHGPQSETAP